MSLADTPARAGSPVSASLDANPDRSRWLRLAADGVIEVSPGKVELGQGILTALVQIAADELDVDPRRIRLLAASTAHSPDEGVTSGSLSVQECGMAIRQVCAELRTAYLAAAGERLGVDVVALRVEDGVIGGPGNARTSYWELDATTPLPRLGGPAEPKAPAARRIAGTSLPRVDIPDKVFGRPRFIHDLSPPGLLHGRILRPKAPAARLSGLDEAAARGPGFVAIVRDGDFVGVLAQTEGAAEAALERLRAGAIWTGGEPLPDEAALDAWLRSRPVETTLKAAREAVTPATAVRTMRRAYSRPYLAHASIAPSCALAQWTGEASLSVWTHSQGVYNLRADLALVLRLPPEAIRVEHAEGAGCYGQNGADDVALDAALLARAAGGRPVRVQWSREDELARSPFGAAMLVEIEADLDVAGEIVAWRHDLWSNGHTHRPGRAGTPTLLAAFELAEPFPRTLAVNPPLSRGGGADRNAVPIYNLPAWRITDHRLLTMPLRTSSLRSLGAFANVFAIESFLDELAAERGEDPLAFRLRHLADPRARAVLEASAVRADWARRERVEGRGYGLGCARYKNSGAYCAVVAEVEGEESIRVRRLVVAVDVGEVINPDGVVNQIEGGAIQATSWTLKEAVRFEPGGVTSDSWDAYPILRFSEAPAVEVEILARPDLPPVGAGEAAQGPTAAAIANAVHDALGVRVRRLPITRDRVIAAAME